MRIRKAVFHFQPFSKKQRMVLNWWCDTSPVKDADGIIADGAIRSGKTVSMSLSFVLWAMTNFNNQNFGMCGKTIGSFRRNVLFWLKAMVSARGYTLEDHRTDNLVIIQKGDSINYFYIFGGKDERSQDLIQGITLAGCYISSPAGAQVKDGAIVDAAGDVITTGVTILPREVKKGDVNGDGAIDVADISEVISVMAGSVFNPHADVNGDEAIDVADISEVITIMASK